MNKIKNEQSGRSMVEMLGVLAIIGVLSVGGIAGYSKAMAKFKLSKAMDQVSTVVTNIRTLYSGQPNYTGLDTSVAIKMGAIPTEMLNGQSPTTASVAYNAFNGLVTVVSGNSFSGDTNRTFTVTFEGLGKEACVALASADWGFGSGTGLVHIGSKTTTHGGTATLSMAEAARLCNQVGDTNSVRWVYY